MMKYSAIGILACVLAGCATPQPAGTPTTVAAKKVHCDSQTGSHIVDPTSCNAPDPWVKHSVISGRTGEPYQTQGN